MIHQQNRSKNNLAGAEERVLDVEELALFTAVHALWGTGVVREFHDFGWWRLESARVGSDWLGVRASQGAILALVSAPMSDGAA
jgi:hypothetical protein